MRKASHGTRCARPPRRHPEDELITWARSVVTQPGPLVTEHERGLIASLVLQAEAVTR